MSEAQPVKDASPKAKAQAPMCKVRRGNGKSRDPQRLQVSRVALGRSGCQGDQQAQMMVCLFLFFLPVHSETRVVQSHSVSVALSLFGLYTGR